MVDIPTSWHPTSRRIAERYTSVFADRYKYWKENLVHEEVVEMYFIKHVANMLWDNSRDVERTNQPKALELYNGAFDVYEHFMRLSGFFMMQGYSGETEFALERMKECGKRIEALSPK